MSEEKALEINNFIDHLGYLVNEVKQDQALIEKKLKAIEALKGYPNE